MAADIMTRTAVDEIFDDNFSDFDDDPFADKPTSKVTRDDKATLSPRSSLKRKAGTFDDKENLGLGLDEEVKIVKKRQPVAKLDEERLLSEPGLPVLRKLIREKQINRKLRLKGKGHEFTDAARLLNYYQLWLDNLYPRAKFADALQLVEKAGHTKRMQMMRCEWINEGKPGYVRSEPAAINVEVSAEEMPDLFETSNITINSATENETSYSKENQTHSSIFGNGLKADSLFIPDGHDADPNEDANGNEPDDDELDALLAMQDDYQLPEQPTKADTSNDQDSEGEDDLDALLAEQDAARQPATTTLSDFPLTLNSDPNYYEPVPDLDVDDLDALLASQETRQSQSKEETKGDSQRSMPADLDDEDAADDLTVVADTHSLPEENANENNKTSGSLSAENANLVADGEDSQLRDMDAASP